MNDLAKRRFDELQTGGQLPSPKGVAMSILEITQRQNSSVADVVPLVQMDPAMAGRILRYANSASSALPRRIASLKQAITFLGLFRVRQIALAFALIDQYRGGKCAEFDYPGYWSASLATGIAAQQLAPHASSPPDESFTCGLLSGVGRLALATAFPADYSALLGLKPTERSLLAAERQRFGIDHVQLAGEMLKGWGLPDIFADAVRHHEDPANAPHAPGSRGFALAATLHFAMRVGQLLSMGEAERWDRVPSLFNAAAMAGLDKDDVPGLVERVAQTWQDWALDLKLPTRAHPDLKALLEAPPMAMAEDEPAALLILPLRVMVVVNDVARLAQLARSLEACGLHAEFAAGWDALRTALRDRPADVAIVDIAHVDAVALDELRTLRQAAGNSLYCLALIPEAEEAEAARLMLAGASDYLLYDAAPTALLARMANAQRQISLQNSVKAERELAVNASGDWGRANRRLIRDALTDVLTQLPNRRYGMDRFAQEWSVATSNDLAIACMMLDIDHFKQVNDTRGHEVGDIVLRQLAAVVEGNCRRSDIVFRYGGEEFCVICPGTSHADATLLAERIVRAVREASFGPDDVQFGLTLSIGLAQRSAGTASVEALIAQADSALYAAKEAGRDRVSCA